ncbi:lipopolysaccharide assembly protein LapB [Marinobacterium arenosum]|uniref:lipopolysaccharide assembly protein LapB n=1 Tax=Marinobacterium arenosum TaxID=2862496 RepID=UPI001C97416D|nr:lipopolysaccharide assembly protein LapB [Marinobacterium arenosum]MBY4676020.1 lipopolysaccharide assembly protein LapB [Marinobacterium arenosum]
MAPDFQSYLFIVPLFLAVAIGWWLGRRQKKVDHRPAANLSNEYFTGLDYLLNERMDEAIESFIRALEINSDTIPAHLALAKLFRRKGDVDRAIKLHQNLLARPDLSRNDFIRIQMALARDYFAVGLLDRAENLLDEIIRQNPPKESRFKALSLLIKLYEKEGEWHQALDTAARMTLDELKPLHRELAHYCCELAEQAIARQGYEEAQGHLRQATQYDPQSVRVGLLDARLAMAQQQWKTAIRHLTQVVERDPLFVSEILADLRHCYAECGRREEFARYLQSCMAQAPSTSVMLMLADQIKQQRGLYAAGSYVTEELKKRPSVKGFNRLIDMHIEHGSESARDSLRVLRGLTGQLELSKPVYRCNSCGFSGKTLHWQCPSCQKWGVTKPIQGLEGE